MSQNNLRIVTLLNHELLENSNFLTTVLTTTFIFKYIQCMRLFA